ncbi:hypothetical protein [Streptomyces sp. ODS28]|uniref:hypothetical protein n=1 Tax=Streptomyces sp. ODS28 TaxID=3136688 RepID=UPI0031E6D485
MRRTSFRFRRAVTAAVAVPFLAMSAAACGGGGDGAGSQGGGDGGGAGTATGGKNGGQQGGGGASVRPLAKGQLAAALLKDGDVRGYRAQRNQQDALPERNTISADKPECAPVTDTVDSRPERARSAYVSGTVLKGDLGTGSTVQQVLLASYKQGEAKKWLADLKRAVESCGRFTGTTGKAASGKSGEKARLSVEPNTSPRVGDEAVRFTMKDVKGKDSPTVFTVVRAGESTATFMSVGVSGKPEPLPDKVLEKQYRKLADAARG